MRDWILEVISWRSSHFAMPSKIQLSIRYSSDDVEVLETLRRSLAVDDYFGFQPTQEDASDIYPDQRLYRPVRVAIQDRVSGLNKKYSDFSKLIATLRDEFFANEHGYGLLLSSRSGAGKTVACWKAFYDCVLREWAIHPPDKDEEGSESPPVADVPKLNGFMPCWLRSANVTDILNNSTIKKYFGNKIDKLVYLSDCLRFEPPAWRQTRSGDSQQIEEAIAQVIWRLKYGPNQLLFFVDLNHYELELRQRIAKSLQKFQREHRDRHCCVVTYRAGKDHVDDEVIRTLTQRNRP